MFKKKIKILFQKNIGGKYDEYIFNISKENFKLNFFLTLLKFLQQNYKKKITLKAYLKAPNKVFPFFSITVNLSLISYEDFANLFYFSLNKFKNFYILDTSNLLVLRVLK
jgi:hypothetical protein